MNVRQMEPSDCAEVFREAEDWWGGLYSSDLMAKWYIAHFRDSCFVAEEANRLMGFLLGFLSQTFKNEAYIRIVMVNPDHRGQGVGRALYDAFTAYAVRMGRNTIGCATSPANQASISFHKSLGFVIQAQQDELEGLPICKDYDGGGSVRVVFKKFLTGS